MHILLADDEKTLRVPLTDDLTDAGHDVLAVADGAAALEAIANPGRVPWDVVVTDLRMPEVDGMQVLRAARERNLQVLVVTGAGSVESAVEAMKEGAYDYIQKPFLAQELLLLLERLEDRLQLGREVELLRSELAGRRGLGRVVGDSPAMRRVLETARHAAASDETIVIVGESGTGKEVLARALHEESARRDGPFVAMSCGTLSESLQEDELFGHEKGAFTDAKSSRQGLFELADSGTLLLDDIDDMRPHTQVKLLRVIQEREFTRVGGTQPLRTDIRLLAASKVDLWNEVQEGRFREDLYYRLHVIQIDLPPLRERPTDIPALIEHFLRVWGESARVSPQAMNVMMCEPWSGNVRQLENAVRRAIAMRRGEDELSLEYLLPATARARAGTAEPLEDWSLAAVVHHAERVHILRALTETGGNRTQAAKILGISRKNLWEKMKALGIDGDAL